MSMLRSLGGINRIYNGVGVVPAANRLVTVSWQSIFSRGCPRAASETATDKETMKKAKTPQGRFDVPEKKNDVLEAFPDDVNPVTKEKGGPRGPEPTRYGDWERKGRCVDF